LFFFGASGGRGAASEGFGGVRASEGGESSKEEGGSVRIALEMKEEGRRKGYTREERT